MLSLAPSQPPLPEPLVTSEPVYSDDELDSQQKMVEELDSQQKVNEELDSQQKVDEGLDSQQKVDEELDSQQKVNAELKWSSSKYDWEKELYRPYHPGDILGDKACWRRYFQQIHESEGFDIKDYPGSGPMTTIIPMEHYVTNPTTREKMKAFAAQALDQYNQKMGTAYEVNEILKVNARCIQSCFYYITLSVKNENGDNEYFQVQVKNKIDNSLEFPIVRPRAKGGLDI